MNPLDCLTYPLVIFKFDIDYRKLVVLEFVKFDYHLIHSNSLVRVLAETFLCHPNHPKELVDVMRIYNPRVY